jgi:hypothetical protein
MVELGAEKSQQKEKRTNIGTGTRGMAEGRKTELEEC